jgi:MFS family permease
MAAGPIVGGLLFRYYGYHAVYVTAFFVLTVDVILRLLLIVEPTQGTSAGQMAKLKIPAALLLLRTPRMWTAIWGSFQTSLICYGLNSIIPLFVLHIYGWNSVQAGASTIALMGPSVLSPLVGWAIDRVGSRKSAVLGYLGSAVALALLSVTERNALPSQPVLMVLLVLAGMFALFSEIASWLDAVSVASAGARAYPVRLGNGFAITQVYGLTNVMSALGFVIGPLFARFIYQRSGWTALVLLLASVSIASTIPKMLWMGQEMKRWPRGKSSAEDVDDQEKDVTCA